MKNLFKFVFIIVSICCNFATGQKYVNENAEELLTETKRSTYERKRLISCTTISCCSIGDLGFDLWSDKECHYIVTNKRVVVVSLKNIDGSNCKNSEIEVKEDILLIDKDNSLEKEGLEAVMKAGLYKVIDGDVAFEPTVQRIAIKKICWVETHQGTILGHEYNYSYSICVYYPGTHHAREMQGSYSVIDINQDEKLLQLAKENGNSLVFDKDTILGEKYILKSGKYPVEDGKIYTRNIQLK
ncbi:MAG: hypothetical protein K0R36_3193 [Chryseobacterium sp.]|jgi:hypothetical protein|nr:hypothetical protein [Chryseobacterium sp.]